MSIVAALGERIAQFAYDALPEDALRWARVGLLDTVGVTLAGAGEESARQVAAVTLAGGGTGQALLFGTGRRIRALDAALINGTASHALDFDDCSDTLGGHPSVPILPGLLALADEKQSPGRDLLTAYIAGWETETRIARAVNFHHYEKGWHPTATLGVFGAAAAAARLMALPPAAIAHALAIAASLSSGVKANFGTPTKPLHIGQCARNGLFAAFLAGEGFTGAPDAFENRQGFLAVYNGAGNYDATQILDGWAAPLDILKPGIAVKQYPCCGSTHPAIDAMIELVETHRLTPGEVDRVEAWTHPRRLAHTNRPDPRTPLDAKFSVQYCLARALMHGRLSLDHFEDGAHEDPAVRAILARIVAAPHPEMSMASTEHFGGEVRIHATDGRVLSAKVDRPLGRGPGKPLPTARLHAKFADCAGRVLDPGAVERLREVLETVDTVADMRIVSNAMIPTERT